MRPLEIILPVLCAISLLWQLFTPNRPPLLKLLPGLAILLTALHISLEKPRWQMFPLYALILLIFLLTLPDLWKSRTRLETRPGGWSRAGLILGLILLAVSASLPALLPIPAVPAPHGPYPVGTLTAELTDLSRKELYSGRDEPRRFLIQIWYPAQPPPAGAQPAAWMPEARLVAPAIADYLELPHFFLDHLALAKTSSYENLPANLSGAPYPLLIFSHGWNGFRQQSTFLMQELASQGYVVVALEHPYGARLTVFPDGTQAPNNPQALPPSSSLPQDEYEATGRILVNQWVGDMRYALDQLEAWNQQDPHQRLTGLLALDRLGVFGHSTGGGAAIQFCESDIRCQAGLTLDAFMRPVSLAVLQQGTRQPFFYLFSELWPFERNTELFNTYLAHSNPESHIVTLLGADHYDFSDLPALTPLASQMGLKGPINGPRVQRIIQEYVVAYFNQALKGQPSPLLDGPSVNYPEVRFDR